MSEAAPTTPPPGRIGPAPAPAVPGSPLPPRAWLAIAAGLIGAFMALLNAQTTAFAIADIRGGIHAGYDEGAWITTAYTVGELAIIPVTAALAAAFTTRFWLMLNAGLFLVFSLACTQATTLEQLLALRLAGDLTGGALIPLAFKIALGILTGVYKPLGITLCALTATFTPTIAAATDGWITDQLGWTGIFQQNAVPGLLCLACGWLGLPREKLDLGLLRRLDGKGALMSAAAFGCAAYVFDQGTRLDWFADPLLARLALLALVFLALFAWHELTAPAPLVDLRLLLWPEFGLPILVDSLFRVGLLAAAMVIPGFLAVLQNCRPLELGPALLWVGLPQLLLAPLVLALTRRFDERPIMTAGLVAFAVGCPMNRQLTSQYQATQFLASQIVQGLAQPFIQVPIMVISTSRIGPAQAASANTLFNTLKTFSAIVGRDRALATIATRVRAQATTMAYADALVAIGLVLVAAVAVVWLIPPPPPKLGSGTWHGVCARGHARRS